MESLLEVTDLTIRYIAANPSQVAAVDHVSFQLLSGEALGVMGESGCGKSSIALALLGLLSQETAALSGSIVFQGEDLLALSERRWQKLRGQSMSLVFQEPAIALCPVLKVGTQVADVVHAHSPLRWRDCLARAQMILERVGLPATDRILSAYPHQLSAGQLQRVVLAQALVCGPKLLILDEATASLDAKSQVGVIHLLRELRKELQLSILLISHTPVIQAMLSDRLLVMQGGRIVETGTVQELYSHSTSPYTRALLGPKPAPPAPPATQPGESEQK